MKEKDITPKILKSMRDDERFGSCLVEIKVAKGNKLYAGQLKEHQQRALELAHFKALYFKIPDLGFQNPADAVILKKSEAYLVIYFDVKPKGEAWAIPAPIMGDGIWTIESARARGVSVLL